MACLAHLPARTRLFEATCLESDGSEPTRFIRPHELATLTAAPVTWNGEPAMLRFRHCHASVPVNTRATQLLAASPARLGAAPPSPLTWAFRSQVHDYGIMGASFGGCS